MKIEELEMLKESQTVEFKKEVNRTYLKTVSAYANYGDGIIVFGITDDGNIIGIDDPTSACLNIENQINDSIKPHVKYTLKINADKTIILTVFKGRNVPYRYDEKAFKRNNTSTIQADENELYELILQGQNITYDSLKSDEQELRFEKLKESFMKACNINSFNKDILVTLNLASPNGEYNNAAYLLADNNNAPGIDVAVFGKDYSILKERHTFKNCSLIKQFEDTLDIFKRKYFYELVKYETRQDKYEIPISAFRESLSNAIVHRNYRIPANIKIEMYEDKVTVISPGGLYYAISKDQFLSGSFSYSRNPIIANVFQRLKIIEQLAIGIKKIKQEYETSINTCKFDVYENGISVTLPKYKNINEMELSDNELLIYESMGDNFAYERKEIEEIAELGKHTAIRALNSLIDKGLVFKSGTSFNVTYSKVRRD